MRNSTGTNNQIDLTTQNILKLEKHYTASKQQATISFYSVWLSCSLGVIVIVAGIVISVLSNQNVILYTAIPGGLAKTISIPFFLLYKYSTIQSNKYYNQLSEMIKYSEAKSIVEKMTANRRDDGYISLLKSALHQD